MWNSNDICFIAGVLEGEATFSSTKSSRYMEVSMTDEDTIQKMYDMTGIGNVRGPYFRKNKKPFWVWHVAKSTELARLLLAISPLMSIRRKQQILTVAEKLSGTSSKMCQRPCDVCPNMWTPTVRQIHRIDNYCSKKCRNKIQNRRRAVLKHANN